jgi:drug/metabolite transporter (DMT)-like permease
MTSKPDNRSFGELMAELSRETSTLVRKEVELATTEMTGKMREAGGHVAVAAAGGALIHAGLLVILAAVVLALIQAGLQPWLAAGIVAVITMIGGYVLMNSGMSRLKRTDFAPRRAIETLKENTT